MAFRATTPGIIDGCYGCEKFDEKADSFRQCEDCSTDRDKWTPVRYRSACHTCGVMHGRPPSVEIAQKILDNHYLSEACYLSAKNWLKWKEEQE